MVQRVDSWGVVVETTMNIKMMEKKDPKMAKEYIERLMTHGTNNDNDGEKTTCKYVEIALRGKFLTIDKANRRYNGYKIIRSGKKRHIYQSQRERDDEKVSAGFFCYDDYLKAGKELLSPEQYREYLYVITELGCGRECQVDDPDIQLLLTDVLPAMGATNLRYRRSISNGRKGGRKRTFSNEELIRAIKEQGIKSQKELAEYFGCSVRTIARRQADDTYQLQFENWEKWHRLE